MRTGNSKLHKKYITDKNGFVRLVWVKNPDSVVRKINKHDHYTVEELDAWLKDKGKLVFYYLTKSANNFSDSEFGIIADKLTNKNIYFSKGLDKVFLSKMLMCIKEAEDKLPNGHFNNNHYVNNIKIQFDEGEGFAHYNSLDREIKFFNKFIKRVSDNEIKDINDIGEVENVLAHEIGHTVWEKIKNGYGELYKEVKYDKDGWGHVANKELIVEGESITDEQDIDNRLDSSRQLLADFTSSAGWEAKQWNTYIMGKDGLPEMILRRLEESVVITDLITPYAAKNPSECFAETYSCYSGNKDRIDELLELQNENNWEEKTKDYLANKHFIIYRGEKVTDKRVIDNLPLFKWMKENIFENKELIKAIMEDLEKAVPVGSVGDASHGGKLHKKQIVTREGKKQTKWVKGNQAESSGEDKKPKEETKKKSLSEHAKDTDTKDLVAYLKRKDKDPKIEKAVLKELADRKQQEGGGKAEPKDSEKTGSGKNTPKEKVQSTGKPTEDKKTKKEGGKPKPERKAQWYDKWTSKYGQLTKLPIGIDEKDVIVNESDPLRKPLLSWRDPKSKKVVYGYTKAFMERNKIEKEKRIARIDPEQIKKAREKALSFMDHKDPAKAETAAVIYIMATTGLRVGNRFAYEVTGNRGVSTLSPESIEVKGEKVSFNFTGKSFHENVSSVTSKKLSDFMKKLKVERKGQEFLFNVGRQQLVNVFEKDMKLKGFKLKDLRTHIAAEVSKDILYNDPMPPPPLIKGDVKTQKKQIQKKLNVVYERVSQKLCNSPAMAKNSYVPSFIIEEWLVDIGVSKDFMKAEGVEEEQDDKLKVPSLQQMIKRKEERVKEVDDEELGDYDKDSDLDEELDFEPLPEWWDESLDEDNDEEPDPDNTDDEEPEDNEEESVEKSEKNKLVGGEADGMSVEDIAKKHKVTKKYILQQLVAGLKVEREHSKATEASREIAMDHLAEDPNYYTKLAKIEEDEDEIEKAKKNLGKLHKKIITDKTGKITTVWVENEAKTGGVLATMVTSNDPFEGLLKANDSEISKSITKILGKKFTYNPKLVTKRQAISMAKTIQAVSDKMPTAHFKNNASVKAFEIQAGGGKAFGGYFATDKKIAFFKQILKTGMFDEIGDVQDKDQLSYILIHEIGHSVHRKIMDEKLVTNLKIAEFYQDAGFQYLLDSKGRVMTEDQDWWGKDIITVKKKTSYDKVISNYASVEKAEYFAETYSFYIMHRAFVEECLGKKDITEKEIDVKIKEYSDKGEPILFRDDKIAEVSKLIVKPGRVLKCLPQFQWMKDNVFDNKKLEKSLLGEEDDTIEKAKKDLSKLHKKIIINKKGKKQGVWVTLAEYYARKRAEGFKDSLKETKKPMIENNKENKLYSTVKKYGKYKEGEIAINKDGIKYRYDTYIIKEPQKWLVNLFNKNTGTGRLFQSENFNVSLARAKFKGENNGSMILSELVKLGRAKKEIKTKKEKIQAIKKVGIPVKESGGGIYKMVELTGVEDYPKALKSLLSVNTEKYPIVFMSSGKVIKNSLSSLKKMDKNIYLQSMGTNVSANKYNKEFRINLNFAPRKLDKTWFQGGSVDAIRGHRATTSVKAETTEQL